MAGINRTTGKATDLITFSRASGGTYLDSDGLLKTASTNIPRIEYAADGTVKGLLIEESRTNLLTYSEDFTNASWNKIRASVTANALSSPDGNVTADELIEDTTSSASHYVELITSITSGQFYSLSVYAKANTRAIINIGGYSSQFGTGNVCFFDLTTGQATPGTGSTASIESVGSGWYRCTWTKDATSTTTGNIYIGLSDGAGNQVYTGDGTSSVYIWGAQLEAGSFPTSYIPTSGATATRAADIASISVDSFGYRQDAGTVVVQAETISTSQANHADLRIKTDTGFVVTDSGSRVGSFAAGSYVVFASATTVNMKVDSVITGGQPYKSAYTIKENDAALSVDGSSIVADTATNFSSYPAGVFELGKGANYLNGHIKSIAYYPRRLSNAQLQELTA